MKRDYFKYGDTEVANNQRVQAYVRNGLVPVGAVLPDCADCDHLAEATGEANGEYQTPALDDAPWYTPRNHDSGSFAGVHIVEVTGLEGSTTQVTIEERVGDGGLVASRRAASKVIGVTADLVGSTPESLSLGIEWLGSVLHPPCVEDVDCTGDVLTMYATCPEVCEGQVDPDALPVSVTYDSGDLATEDGLLLGAVEVGICDTVTVTWTLTAAVQDVLVQVGTATPGGVPTWWGDEVVVSPPDAVDVVMTLAASPEFPLPWRPILRFVEDGGTLTVTEMVVTMRPVLSTEDCVSPYRRTLHNVVTVEGPRVVEYRTLGDLTDGSTVARVEWTWVATDPFIWHDPTPLLTNVEGRTSDDPAYQLAGIPLSGVATVTAADTACSIPAVTALTCADNTACGAITLPPQAPLIADPCIMAMPTSISRRYFDIPSDLSPQGLGVLSWVFDNDERPKFGVRVRIYEDFDPAFVAPPTLGPDGVCTFVEEFTITYLGPNHVLHIDGPGGRVWVECGLDAFNQIVTTNALRNMRGNYGGPFRNSPIGCGRAYMVTVEVPQTYTSTPIVGAPYASGDTQGDLLWSVTLVERG